MSHRSIPTLVFALGLLLAGPSLGLADNPAPLSGTVAIGTPHTYKTLIARLDRAVKDNGMGLVTRASATVGAARVLKKKIPGNMVIGVFHPRFAVRMLDASVPAGIEAPLRFYITENADGTATLSYRRPTSTFAPYGNAALDKMAGELDGIFDRIARQATAK